MKWLTICALGFALPLGAFQGKNKEPPPPPFDADLFRKDEQIYSANVEFLYWTVNEGCLDYALKMRHDAWGPSPSYAQGKFELAQFDLDPGFRLGFLFFRAPRYWEIRWQYTRLTCQGDNSCGKPEVDQKFLTGTWPQVTTAPLAGARSHIHMNYNVFDFTVDRYFIPNPHLRLRLLGGGTAAWISQDWKVHYVDSALRGTTIRNRRSFIGAGLKSGTMVDWYWTGHLYMTGLGTVGALLGTYTNKALQKSSFQPTASDNTAIPIRDTFFRDTRPVFTMQVMFGPSWQYNFTHNRIEFFCGYELNLWLNLQEIYRSTGGGPTVAKETWINTSLMAVQGLTTRLTLDF
jgi:hypothetical protein